MAVERLGRVWERLVAYYAFPKAHSRHLRTTNGVEPPFDAARLRTSEPKRFKRVENATALIWRLLLVVERHFWKLSSRTSVPRSSPASGTRTASASPP
jgi:transposase-like protein